MPLYEYECQKCHHRFERIQKFSDPHVKSCPNCAGPVQLVISAPAVQFKGSGWYVTDYASKSSQAPPTNGSSSETKGKKEEAKPKTEAKKNEPKK
jgi:putative FmdB family regulatory protein